MDNTKEITDLLHNDPVREVIFDMTWNYADWHGKQSVKLRSDIMELLEGSRGLFDWINAMAEQFQAYWTSLPENDPALDSYYEQIEDWMSRAIKVLLVQIELEKSNA